MSNHKRLKEHRGEWLAYVMPQLGWLPLYGEPLVWGRRGWLLRLDPQPAIRWYCRRPGWGGADSPLLRHLLLMITSFEEGQ